MLSFKLFSAFWLFILSLQGQSRTSKAEHKATQSKLLPLLRYRLLRKFIYPHIRTCTISPCYSIPVPGYQVQFTVQRKMDNVYYLFSSQLS